MRAITVYRWECDSNTGYRTRHPIGAVLELRKYERVNNYIDLLRLVRKLFALDAADAVQIVIDMSQVRRGYVPELTGECLVG